MAAGEYVCERVEVEDEADGRFAPAEVGRQFVIAPAAPDARACARDIDFIDQPRVVIETRHIAQIDLETISQLQSFQHAPNFRERVERRCGACVGQLLARGCDEVALAREASERMVRGVCLRRPRARGEEAVECVGVARVYDLAHLFARRRIERELRGQTVEDFDVIERDAKTTCKAELFEHLDCDQQRFKIGRRTRSADQLAAELRPLASPFGVRARALAKD